MLLPTRWWSRTLEPLASPLVGEVMLGFNNESQGWFTFKIVEEAPHKGLWTVDWWDNLQENRSKGEEELRPFEETGWWYRIVQKTWVKRCPHCQNTDDRNGQWRTEEEWWPKDWNKTWGNTRCKECLHQGLGHDGDQETTSWRKTLQRKRTSVRSSEGIDLSDNGHNPERRRQGRSGNGHIDGQRPPKNTDTWTVISFLHD